MIIKPFTLLGLFSAILALNVVSPPEASARYGAIIDFIIEQQPVRNQLDIRDSQGERTDQEQRILKDEKEQDAEWTELFKAFFGDAEVDELSN